MRPPTLYMISEASGNVYWEISAFQHVVVISSTRGEGGERQEEATDTDFRSNRDINEVLYKCFFFPLRENHSSNRVFNVFYSLFFFFCDVYIEEGDGKKKPD